MKKSKKEITQEQINEWDKELQGFTFPDDLDSIVPVNFIIANIEKIKNEQ